MIIGTLRGVRGRGVEDYTSLNRRYLALLWALRPRTPPSPYPPKGPYEMISTRVPYTFP